MVDCYKISVSDLFLNISIWYTTRFKKWLADYQCKEVICSLCSYKNRKGWMDGSYQQVYSRPTGKKLAYS